MFLRSGILGYFKTIINLLVVLSRKQNLQFLPPPSKLQSFPLLLVKTNLKSIMCLHGRHLVLICNLMGNKPSLGTSISLRFLLLLCLFGGQKLRACLGLACRFLPVSAFATSFLPNQFIASARPSLTSF